MPWAVRKKKGGGRGADEGGMTVLESLYCQFINGARASATRVASCPLGTGPGLWAGETPLKNCFVHR